MTSDDAPAMAYLKASPNSNLTFVRMKGDGEKWLSCPQCKKYVVPPDQHVGDVFESGSYMYSQACLPVEHEPS